MKKRLESELISIAHRILKLKNKSEVDQLYKETQKLYETLSVLKFYQDNFESIKDDVSLGVLEEKIEKSLENEISSVETTQPTTQIVEEIEPVVEEKPTEEKVVLEKEKEIEGESEAEVDEEEPVFKPIFELGVEEDETEPEVQIESELSALSETELKPETKQVSFEELLGENYADTVFVKPNDTSLFSSEETEEEPKTASLNSAFSKSIEIGLNDRIAFVNNLFGESNEDFNRVISQLNTFDTFEEAKNFINEMVIPDYNYWVGKEEYLERFMEVVEKKFQ